MKIVHDKNKSAPASAAPPVTISNTIQQLIERSKTPEAKIKAFEKLFCRGTDESIAKAVDYFFEDPVLFSKTVQNLAGEDTHEEQLKRLLHKMGESEERIFGVIREQYIKSLDAQTTRECKAALDPIHALREAFLGADRNRRATRSCPNACDLLPTFERASDKVNQAYTSELFKKIAKLYVMNGPQ